MLHGRRITVLGAGRSGRAAATLALRLGAEVVLTDRGQGAPLAGARCVFGRHDRADLVGADLVVVSPGIPAAAAPVREARDAGVEVVGELGFAWSLLPQDLPVVAVTGTNGKSTVTTFVGQLFAAAGRRAFVGGNLGTPLSEAWGQPWDVAVVEVSSYQLELPGTFRATAAAILNLTPDHLDRHGDMAGYAQAKARVFDRMPADGLAALPHDPLLVAAAAGKPGRRAWLDAQPGVTVEGDVATVMGETLPLRDLAAVGAINRWNAAVACLLAMHAGAGVGLTADELRIDALRPLAHRLEPVAERDGVLWVNDSKATNVDAAMVGVRAMERPAVVLLGGQGKQGADYAALQGPLSAARAVVCFGQEGPVIARALAGLHPHLVPDLASAAALASRLATPGDAVLLSPACASFDEFNNFEHRGEAFRALAGEALAS